MKKRIISGILSAALVLGTIPAIPVSAAIDMEHLPTPLSAEKDVINEFTHCEPKLGLDKDGDLEWESVKGALYYEVYKRNDYGSFELYGTTFDTYYWWVHEGEYRIRAVSYTYDDVKKRTKFSNIVSNMTYFDYDDEPEDDYDYDDAVSYAGAADDEDYEEDYYAYAPSASAGVASEEDEIDEIDYNEYNTEEYGSYAESGWKTAAISPISTFSADVDTASYANLRRLISKNYSIPDDAVRIEEMLNYFSYEYEIPKDKTFSINTELTDCPWNSDAQLLTVGIQGRKPAKTPNSNLVFLVDTSGSMSSKDKLPLVIESIKMLAKTMGENDRISIVTYSGEERVILAGANGTQIKTISDLVSILSASGSTNGESGINAAYQLAEKYYIEGGNNRIILATDGDLNVGISSEKELKKLIEKKRKSGVYFSVLGYGEGNIKDNKMETLADNGNGSYHYIDTAKEAAKVLVEERDSTLFTIAGDVKIQVEFNPENVKSYRLIGYDNRRLENEDFTNDAKDAGEVGSGHSVTAVYEIIPADGKSGESLKYQQSSSAADSSELLTVKIRFKNPKDGNTYQLSSTVDKNSYTKEMSDNMKLACAVTEFGLVLKNSGHKGSATVSGALSLAKGIKDPDTYEAEFIKLLEKYIEDHKK